MKKFLLILLISFTACDRFIQEVPAPEEDPKLAVICVLSPGVNTISLKLTLSKPVFGPVDYTKFQNVKDATVTISSGGVSKVLKYDQVKERYLNTEIDNTTFLAPDKEYFLLITTPDNKSVTSTTIIPHNDITEASIALDSFITDVSTLRYNYGYTTTFTHSNGIGEYFQISSTYNGGPFVSDFIEMDYGLPLAVFKSVDPAAKQSSKRGTGPYLPDKNDRNIGVDVQTVSRDYYLYYSGLNAYQGFYYDENPFTEPTILHNNIEGGLGLFGARNAKSFDVVLE